MRLKLSSFVLAISALTLLNGCSLSESSSKIISSPIESMSASSGSSSKSPGDSYQKAVRDYTETYVRTNGDPSTFEKGLANVAKDHGVTNWQADPDTYLGIGAGLRKAGVSKAQLEAYKQNWSGGDSTRAANIQKGYDTQP